MVDDRDDNGCWWFLGSLFMEEERDNGEVREQKEEISGRHKEFGYIEPHLAAMLGHKDVV